MFPLKMVIFHSDVSLPKGISWSNPTRTHAKPRFSAFFFSFFSVASLTASWRSGDVGSVLCNWVVVGRGLFVFTCACVCMYVCMYVCTYVCMYVRTYVRMYVCMYLCIYAFMYVCMYICIYVFMYLCLYVCTYVCMHACMHVCTYVHISIYIQWYKHLDDQKSSSQFSSEKAIPVAFPSHPWTCATRLLAWENNRTQWGCHQVPCLITLWLFNIAMENCPFIDGLPGFTYKKWWFSMAMLNNQMVPQDKESCKLQYLGFMVVISIVNGDYKPTYNWGGTTL